MRPGRPFFQTLSCFGPSKQQWLCCCAGSSWNPAPGDAAGKVAICTTMLLSCSRNAVATRCSFPSGRSHNIRSHATRGIFRRDSLEMSSLALADQSFARGHTGLDSTGRTTSVVSSSGSRWKERDPARRKGAAPLPRLRHGSLRFPRRARLSPAMISSITARWE